MAQWTRGGRDKGYVDLSCFELLLRLRTFKMNGSGVDAFFFFFVLGVGGYTRTFLSRKFEDNDALVLSDSDYVANLDARRYVTGYAFTIDNSLAS